MKRVLATLLLAASALVGAQPASAGASSPAARLSVSRSLVGAGGGAVAVWAVVQGGRSCTWSSVPALPRFAGRTVCRSVLTRTAVIGGNRSSRIRRIVFRLTVTGATTTVARTVAVAQLGRRPAPTTTRARACTPLTNGGKCYEPGEFCRKSDHGATGVAGNGETIVCTDNNGWRWEPVHAAR